MARKTSYLNALRGYVFPAVIAFVFGLLGAFVFQYTSQRWQGDNARIRSFYEDEMATVVSPTTVKGMIDKHDESYILVDLRSKAEYDQEHILTAINIPTVSMKEDEIVSAFRNLPADKQVIVHCYSASCTLGRRIGQLLSRHGIFVKEMDVGWNEWRYHWDHWNPGAGPLDGKDYIATGSANPNGATFTPCTEGEFGC